MQVFGSKIENRATYSAHNFDPIRNEFDLEKMAFLIVRSLENRLKTPMLTFL